MSAPPEFCPDSWGLVSCQPDGGCSHLDNLNPDHQEVLRNAAREYLWRWTGRRFGLCKIDLRPCQEDCSSWSTYRGWSGAPAGFPFGVGMAPFGMYPIISGGNWYNIICGRCNKSRCSCSHLSNIVLPGPVDSVVEVLIDGIVLDPAAYRVDNLGISRIDGGVWPRCQNMAHDPFGLIESPETDASNTFLVSYMRGTPVPAGGQLAAGTLACELAKQACGDKSCRLPKRAVTVAREGVTVMMPDSSAQWLNGSKGIDEIDDFLSSVQHDNKVGFKVTSPDARKFRRSW